MVQYLVEAPQVKLGPERLVVEIAYLAKELSALGHLLHQSLVPTHYQPIVLRPILGHYSDNVIVVHPVGGLE